MRPAIYFTKGNLYIFTQEGVHLTPMQPHFGNAWRSTTCLVDADLQMPLPEQLLVDSLLFVLLAASPRDEHRRWIKQRNSTKVYVLNPPEEQDLVTVSVWSFVPACCAHTLQYLSLPASVHYA